MGFYVHGARTRRMGLNNVEFYSFWFNVNLDLLLTNPKKVLTAILWLYLQMVWLETPTNPTLKLTDIKGAAKIVQQHEVYMYSMCTNQFQHMYMYVCKLRPCCRLFTATANIKISLCSTYYILSHALKNTANQRPGFTDYCCIFCGMQWVMFHSTFPSLRACNSFMESI